MFTVKMDLQDFARLVGFWGNGTQTQDFFESLTEDEVEYLNDLLLDYEFDSLTSVNDFMWFDAPDFIKNYRGGNEE